MALVDWTPLLGFPVEWAALALFVVACLYWERSGFSGLGVEGCVASAILGLILGYEWFGSYALAALSATAASVGFALVAAGLVRLLRADPAVGVFSLSLVPAAALGWLTRGGPFRIFGEVPSPGLIPNTVFAGTNLENFLASPWVLSTPLVIALSVWILWHTPLGLRVRAFGETPGWRVPGSHATLHRLLAVALGALWVVPGAALMVRAHPEAPPIGLGWLALACAVAGRWSFTGGLLLAIGPALLRAARPYAVGQGGWSIAVDVAPFLLALLYLIFFARRSLRIAASPQSRLDPDVL
jgi:simple sugar transport system permease protein